MKRLVLIVSLFLAVPAFAQSDKPSFEIFGGASWVRADVSPDLKIVGLDHVNGYGWNASATENLNSWFGGTLDFSGIYSRPTIRVAANAFGTGSPAANITLSNELNASAYTFMYGPSIAYRHAGRFVPFARVLLGAVNGRASTTSKGAATIASAGIVVQQKFSETHFGLAAGGGVDVALSHAFAVRGAADWIRSTFPDFGDDRQNNLRVSAGIVYRFGNAR